MKLVLLSPSGALNFEMAAVFFLGGGMPLHLWSYPLCRRKGMRRRNEGKKEEESFANK